MAKREKHVFKGREIYHVFNSQNVNWGRSGNMSFDGELAFSYSEPIGRLVTIADKLSSTVFGTKGKPQKITICLLRDKKFSVTTSSHQSALQQATSNKQPSDILCKAYWWQFLFMG